MTNKKMLPADFLEYVAGLERTHGRLSFPVKRRQPRVTRHASRNQRIANRQSPNIIASMYRLEGKYTVLPLKDESVPYADGKLGEGREVGPNDKFNHESGYRTGKNTSAGHVTRGDGNKVSGGRQPYVKTGKYTRQSQPKIDIAALAKQYEL